MNEPFDYKKDIHPVIRKYSNEPKNETYKIISKEAKIMFAKVSTVDLVEMHKNTNYKWLTAPELERRTTATGQLPLF